MNLWPLLYEACTWLSLHPASSPPRQDILLYFIRTDRNVAQDLVVVSILKAEQKETKGNADLYYLGQGNR
jgi:hypothetical protein